jgi:hypothetical protein
MYYCYVQKQKAQPAFESYAGKALVSKGAYNFK